MRRDGAQARSLLRRDSSRRLGVSKQGRSSTRVSRRQAKSLRHKSAENLGMRDPLIRHARVPAAAAAPPSRGKMAVRYLAFTWQSAVSALSSSGQNDSRRSFRLEGSLPGYNPAWTDVPPRGGSRATRADIAKAGRGVGPLRASRLFDHGESCARAVASQGAPIAVSPVFERLNGARGESALTVQGSRFGRLNRMTTGCGTRLNWSGSPRTSRVTPLKPAWSPSQRITVGLVHGVAQRPDLPRSPASGRRASTRVSTRQARVPAPRSNTDAYEDRRGLRGFSDLVVQTGD